MREVDRMISAHASHVRSTIDFPQLHKFSHGSSLRSAHYVRLSALIQRSSADHNESGMVQLRSTAQHGHLSVCLWTRSQTDLITRQLTF
jgi:hypothetical protein